MFPWLSTLINSQTDESVTLHDKSTKWNQKFQVLAQIVDLFFLFLTIVTDSLGFVPLPKFRMLVSSFFSL